MNEMYEMITQKKKAQQEAEKALMNGRPSKGMYAYDSDEDTEGWFGSSRPAKSRSHNLSFTVEVMFENDWVFWFVIINFIFVYRF